eukprot:14544025-Ditylum_brightwellii.AAC.1
MSDCQELVYTFDLFGKDMERQRMTLVVLLFASEDTAPGTDIFDISDSIFSFFDIAWRRIILVLR